MKVRLIGLALLLIGIGIIGQGYVSGSAIALTVGAVLAAIAAAILISSEPKTLFRLDHFIPFANPGWHLSSDPGLVRRFFRRILPKSFLFNPDTGRQGYVRRFLHCLGPSVRSSPGRRLIQGVFFIGFLILFFYVCWPYTAEPTPAGENQTEIWPSHYTDDLAEKEVVSAEVFLIIDPLVSISTAMATRSWVWSLVCAGVILLVCVIIPRGFCGYLCPLGTLIDLFDWALGKRVKRFRISGEGWWVHIKYYVLLATLICSLFGILVSGFVSAIPVITRGFLFIGEPLQIGFLRGWHLIPPMNAGHWLSIALFLGILFLGFLRPRFWCKYVCPSGAIFSVANLFRVAERKVEDTCINCNKCVDACGFDAIKPDFTTRETDCTFCQTCAGVCPTHSIKFVERWNTVGLKDVESLAPGESPIGRRGFMALWTGLTAAIVGSATAASVTKIWGANLATDNPPVRPPGSLPEPDFLQACIRCGECYKVCPENVLQSQGFEQGFQGLWTPIVNADWAGCDPSCNACGQVCPTGAIRALPLAEKKSVRMGLAIVNESTCLPLAGREACQLCVDACDAAGYGAIGFTHLETDALGNPIPGTGYATPLVSSDKCVGCGLCQTACNGINVGDKGLLRESAIIIEAGDGKEDRLL